MIKKQPQELIFDFSLLYNNEYTFDFEQILANGEELPPGAYINEDGGITWDAGAAAGEAPDVADVPADNGDWWL